VSETTLYSVVGILAFVAILVIVWDIYRGSQGKWTPSQSGLMPLQPSKKSPSLKLPRIISDKRKIEYDKLLKDFDDSFDAVIHASEPKTKKKMLADFRHRLYNLVYYDGWTNDITNRVTRVLDHIHDELLDDEFFSIYLDYLNVIFGRNKEADNKIKEIFLNDLESMFDKPNHRTNPQLFGLLQNMHRDDKNYWKKLANDVLDMDKWEPERYEALRGNARFSELMGETRDEIKALFAKKQNVAEKRGYEEIRKRAEYFYDQMK